jgi:glutamate dehydrogenase (NAD(P)+)
MTKPIGDFPSDPIASSTFQDPITGASAYLVLDSLLDGRGAGGGVRMMPSVTLEETKRLARAMTYKYGVIGVPSGGAKLGIVGDPGDPRKAEKLRAVARFIAPLVRADVYRFGEDMGITKDDVTLMYREIGVDPIELARERAKRLGKTLSLSPGATMATLGGPDFEDTITGHGLMEVFLEACEVLGLDPLKERVAIQGFGTVGGGFARLLAKRGVRVVAVADIEGTLEHADGLPLDTLYAARNALGTIERAKLPAEIRRRPREEWLDVPADVIVPAAIADTITEANVDRVRACLVLEAANIPVTEGAEAALHARGVTVVPDFVANAGAAAGYAMIWFGQTVPTRVYEDVGERLRGTARAVLARSSKGELPRIAAREVALENLGRYGVSFNRPVA